MMGFLVKHEDGTTRDIVTKSHDEATNAELFTDVEGRVYTRSLNNDAHTVIDYAPPGPYVERDDGDLTVFAELGVDLSTAPAANPAAPVTDENGEPLAVVPSENNDGSDTGTATEPTALEALAGEDTSGEAVADTPDAA